MAQHDSRLQAKAGLRFIQSQELCCLEPSSSKIHMNSKADEAEEFTQSHKDGSVWARGHVLGDVPVGYWEWFRRDGTIMRSGYFREGLQVGEWTTYDADGAVYKVTDMKDGRSGKETIVRRQ